MVGEPLAAPLDLIPLSQNPAEVNCAEPFPVDGDRSELDAPWLSSGEG